MVGDSERPVGVPVGLRRGGLAPDAEDEEAPTTLMPHGSSVQEPNRAGHRAEGGPRVADPSPTLAPGTIPAMPQVPPPTKPSAASNRFGTYLMVFVAVSGILAVAFAFGLL